MKKPLLLVLLLMAAAGLLWAGNYYWRHPGGRGPAVPSPPQDLARPPEASQEPVVPPDSPSPVPFSLKLPPGFAISIVARNLGGPRALALDPGGNLLVSLTRQGKVVALPDKDGDGVADRVVTVLKGLKNPHGLAFGGGDPPRLYVAETRQVTAYNYNETSLKADKKRRIINLPPGGRHFTRTLLFLPPPHQHRLLISVGSWCDVCVEKDWRRAKILVADADGAHLEIFASGLRNSVFMAVHPITGHVWATEMGRDYLGDNLPPDEINLIIEGGNYGWPYCYGKRVHDDRFDPAGAGKEFCKDTIPSYLDIPAHSAPLGLAFFPREWPKEFRYHLLVAYHGSWNRTRPTGYKVVRFKLDREGNYLGQEDFITGWLTPTGARGRPVDILIRPDGVIFISDDHAGVIYRAVYNRMVKK
jgi:glucose/arabinose dehydrogenase